MRRRVELQNSGEYSDIYIMIADSQALTDNADNPEKVRQNILEVALDYLSAGLDPEKSTIFIQSMVPELYEMTALLYGHRYRFQIAEKPYRKERDPDEKLRGKHPGWLLLPTRSARLPISQHSRQHTVPVGEDQMPMIEQCKRDRSQIQYGIRCRHSRDAGDSFFRATTHASDFRESMERQR